MDSIKNSYIESSEENLNLLIKKGVNIGICPFSAILKSKYIVINEFGNLFGFDNLPKKYELKYLLNK